MVVVRSEITETLMVGRHRRLELRQRGLDRIHRADDVGAGQPLDGQNDAALLVDPTAQRLVLRSDRSPCPTSDTRDRTAVAVGDDLIVPTLRVQDLVVGLQGIGAAGCRTAALRLIDADIGQRVPHVLKVEAVGGELRRIELDANRRVLLAADADQSDAGHLR